MRFALDYDGTFDRDPNAWWRFIRMMRQCGHQVDIVTFRHSTDRNAHFLEFDANLVPVHYTNGVAKVWYMMHFGGQPGIDVWIDDTPSSLLYNSTLTREGVAEWRQSLNLTI